MISPPFQVDAQLVGYAKDLLDEGGHDPRMVVDIGGELLVPGYPLGLPSNGCMAIWKKASLASSLEFGHGIRQFFYVDMATREGMSRAPGSPFQCGDITHWIRIQGKERLSKGRSPGEFLGFILEGAVRAKALRRTQELFGERR